MAQTNNCPGSLAPNAACAIHVTFTPTAGGNRSASVIVADNAPGSPQEVPLSGLVPDFSLTANMPTSQTVTPGQAANYAATVSPLNGFAQSVSLTCSDAPALSTCSITPSSVTLDGTNSATVNVAVVTAPASMGLTQPIGGPPGGGWLAAWAGLSCMLGAILTMSSRHSRRHWQTQALRAIASLSLFSFGLMLPACGGGGAHGGTPVGTYNVTVTGAFSSGSATLTHATNVTLVVQ